MIAFQKPRWEESNEILEGMIRRGRRANGARRCPMPDSTTYGTVITACSKGRKWELALDLLDDMLSEVIYRIQVSRASSRTVFEGLGEVMISISTPNE